jgi:hemerythrin-like metal-binding protein/PAS domain S-box-containing protein
MAILEWNNDFSVGLASVDYQHKHLVAIINALDEAVSLGSDEETLRGIIKELYAYTEYHFTTEEEMMRAAGAPLREHYRRHKAEHDKFTAKIRPLGDLSPLDSSTLNEALFDYLIRWLVDHIMGSDKQMGHLIREVSAWAETLEPMGEAITPEGGVFDDAHRDSVQRNLLGALKESETRFRNLSDSIPVLIWVADVDGERTFFNKTWRDFTGQSETELAEGGWLEHLHPDEKNRYQSAIRNALAGGEGVSQEVRLRRVDGRYRWMYESTVPRLSPAGEFIGLIGCSIDITERKAAEQVLVRARERLEQDVNARTAELRTANEQLEREKAETEALLRKLQETQQQLLQSEKLASIGQLAAGVAHEINNPVGYISSNLGSLDGYVTDILRLLDAYAAAENSLDDAEREKIAGIKKAIDIDFLRSDLPALIRESQSGTGRVKSIVQDLKDFSHVDEAEWQWADLHKGIDSTLNVVHNEIKYKAEVVREYGDLPRVNCIPAQLNQVFMNLLVNAAQAIPERGTIAIRTGQEQEWVWVEISDTGVGIPEEHLKRIFDPFFTTKPVGKGTGLGLSLAYGIVQKHHGRFEVESKPGEGTRFRIWLPVNGPDSVAAEPEPENRVAGQQA